MRYDSALAHAVELARKDAFELGHDVVTVFHLLAAIIQGREIRETIRQAGGSCAALSAYATSNLRKVQRPTLWERIIGAVERRRVTESTGFRHVLGAAWQRALACGQAEVSPIDVLSVMFAEPELRVGFRQSKLTRRALLQTYCHAECPSTEEFLSVPSTTHAEVVLFNDNFTEMDTVVRILAGAFSLPMQAAYDAMMEVHELGHTVVGPFATNDAVDRYRAAVKIAESEEAPLKLVLQSAECD